MSFRALFIFTIVAAFSFGCRTTNSSESDPSSRSVFAAADDSSRSELKCTGLITAVETTNLTTTSGHPLVFHRIKTDRADLIVSSELQHADLLRTGFSYAKEHALPVCTRSEKIGAQQLTSVISVYFGELPFVLNKTIGTPNIPLSNSLTAVRHLEISRTGKILFQLYNDGIGIGNEDDPIRLRSQLEWLMMSYLYKGATEVSSSQCPTEYCQLQIVRMRPSNRKPFGFHGVALSQTQILALSSRLLECRSTYHDFIEEICDRGSSICNTAARAILQRAENGKAG